MKTIWPAGGVAALMILTGCSSPISKPGAAFDRINQEMAQATTSKPKVQADDAMGKAVMPPLQLDVPVAQVVEPRFNLAVNNAPASQVFMALVSGTKYSMVFAPDLSGTITLNLKNVTVREALETIRELYGYEYKFQGDRIMIQSNSMQTRIFQINYLSSRRQGTSETRVTSSALRGTTPTGAATSAATSNTAVPGATPGTAGSAQSAVNASSVQTISENDFWKDLRAALEMIVGQQDGKVILNPLSGVLLVKALPSELRAVESYLKATQVIVERQVMLEAKIIDVQLNDQYQAGINWAAFDKFGRHRWSNNLNTQNIGFPSGRPLNVVEYQTRTITSGGVTITEPVQVVTQSATLGGLANGVLNEFPFPGKGVGFAFQTGSFASLISFLETQGSVYVMSNPRIATLNNQKAVLKVGTDEYFVTNISTTTTTSTTGSQVTPTITTQPFFSGIALDVTPQIDDEGNVVLHIHPVVTEVSEKNKQLDLGSLGGNITLPLASSRTNETDSIVRVKDGHIVAIGGLMSQGQNKNRTGLPGVSAAPGVGALFGRTDDSASKRELVILLKPTVIQNESSWRQDLVEAQERIQGLDPRRQMPTPQ